jgi:hypothetical protein
MADARRCVRVYAGAGVSVSALEYTLDGLRAELAPSLTVSEVLPEELLAGGWEASTGALRRTRWRLLGAVHVCLVA